MWSIVNDSFGRSSPMPRPGILPVRRGARAHVQVERVRVARRGEPVGVPDGRAVAAPLLAGEVDRLRQLHDADVEVRGRGEGEEQEVDPHLDRGDEVDGTGSERGQPCADPDAREREAERLDVDGGAEGDAEAVLVALGVPLALGWLATTPQSISVSQAWTSKLPLRPKPPPPIVIPPFRSTPKWPLLSTQPSAFSVARPKKSADAGEAEEPLAFADRLVDVGVAAWRPVGHLLVAADDHVDRRVQVDHAEQADGAVDVELERVRRDQDPVRNMIRTRVVFSRIWPLPLIVTMSKTLKLMLTSSCRTRPVSLAPL